MGTPAHPVLAFACEYPKVMTDPTAPPKTTRTWASLEHAIKRVDPNLGPQLVVAAALVLDVFLPERLTLGPSWLLPSIEGALLVVFVGVGTHPLVRDSPNRRRIAIALIGLVSAVNIVSLVLLAHYLLHGGKAGGRPLIFSGIALWGTNVLLFGLWYWQLDRGGPLERARPGSEKHADFIFSQMGDAQPYTPAGWVPGLIDYLWLSFTTATAFSPTDTLPLTQNAKLLMAVQSLTSLLIVVLVVARAVNIIS